MTRTELMLWIAVATLAVSLASLLILLWRQGLKPETKAIIDAVHGARWQVDVHQQKVEGELKVIKGWLRRLLTRFGFGE